MSYVPRNPAVKMSPAEEHAAQTKYLALQKNMPNYRDGFSNAKTSQIAKKYSGRAPRAGAAVEGPAYGLKKGVKATYVNF